MTPTLIKSYPAEAAVTARRIVAFSEVSTNNMVSMASANTQPAFGISAELDTPIGGMCDVIVGGVALLKLGGTVTAGAPIMSDANGCGVAATAASAATRRVVGFALEPGVSGDIISVLAVPSLLDRA